MVKGNSGGKAAAPKGGGDSHREVAAAPKASPKASHNIASDLWHKTTSAVVKHIEKHPVVRYLGAKVKEGQKEVKSFIARAEKQSHSEVSAHKFVPQERRISKVTDSKGGHTAEIRAKNGSTLKLEYKDAKQPGKLTGYAVVDKHGTFVAGGESSKNVSIRFDDKSGNVIEQRKKLTEHKQEHKQEEIILETHVTPEGTYSVIERDASGRRREKRYFDSSRTERARTQYKYEKKPSRGPAGRVSEAVVATQFDESGELRHQYVFASPEALENNKASTRLDRIYKNEKGIHSECIERFDLKKDSINPISRSKTESDFNVGKVKVSHEQLEGGKTVAAQTGVYDEMGRLREFSLKSKAGAQDFTVKFDRNCRPAVVNGETGDLGEKGAKELALLSGMKDERIAPMDHGELLAVRGPSAPRQGDKAFGTLAFKDGDRFVSRYVENGVIYGPNKEKLGTIKDNGDVTMGGETFNILTDAKRAAAFTGKGTDGLYLDLTAGQSLSGGGGEGVKNGGFTGYIENGRERMLTIGGHVFQGKQLFGQVAQDGKMSFNRELAQAEKDGTPISQVLMGSSFVGKEDGFERRVNFTRTASGSVMLPPSLEMGVDSSGETELRLGMLIDKRTNRQLANFEVPTLNETDRQFCGGALVVGNKRLMLNEVEGLVFRAKVDGDEKLIQGVVAGKAERQADGTIRPNSSLIVNLDDYAELSTNNFKDKTKQYKDSAEHKERSELLEKFKYSSGAGFLYSEYRKNEDYSAEAKETAFGLAARQFHSDMSTINNLLSGGQADAQELQKLKANHEQYVNSGLSPKERLAREIDRPGHELEQVAPGAQVSGKILRPVLGKPGEIEEFVVSGKLIYKAGSEHPVGSVDFATGKVVWPEQEGVKSLGAAELRGTVFGCNYLDKDGKSRTLNWVNDGQGLLSTDTLRKQVAQECAYAKLLSKDSKDDNLISADKRTSELAKRYNKLLNDVDSLGVKDASLPESGFTALELLRRGPRDIVRAEHNKEGRHYQGQTIKVPPMNSTEDIKKASGAMRLGNAHYVADHGKLYHAQAKRRSDGEVDWVRAEGEKGKAPCGVLKPGYKAEIFGQKDLIDLQSERNFLFKMQIEGVSGERLIMGLGAPRRDAAGNLIGGGLIDAQEVLRRNNEARSSIALSAKQYRDEETWLGLGALADKAMGGREAQLDGVAGSADGAAKLMQKQMNQLFNEGVDGNTLTTADAMRNIDSIERRMRELNLSASDAAELSAQGRSNQASAREGLAMVATTFVSGGTSLLVNAGKITLAQGALTTLVGGGLSSAAIRQTRGGDWRQFAQNAGAGGLETTLMLATGGIGKTSGSFSALGKSAEVVDALADARYLPKLQGLAQEGKLVGNLEKLADLQASGQLSKVSTRVLAELSENPQALKLAELLSKGGSEAKAVQAACELLSNKKSADLLGKLAIGGPQSFSAIGMVGTACNATLQTVGFNVVGSGRAGAEIDLNLKNFIGNNIAGTAWTLAGDFVGNLTHVNVGPKFLESSKTALSQRDRLFDGVVSSYAENLINNSTNSALMALTEVRKVERENIARELGIAVDKVDDQMYEEHKNEARMNAFIFDRALEGAATAAFTHPITHGLTHHLGSGIETQKTHRQRDEFHAQEISYIEEKINRQPASDVKYADLPKVNAISDKSKPAAGQSGWAVSAGKDEGNQQRRQEQEQEHEHLDKTVQSASNIGSSNSAKGLFADAKFHRDASQALSRVEVFPGGEFRKDESGWSFYYQDKLVKSAEFSKLELGDKGRVRTVDKHGTERLHFADGSSLVREHGLLSELVDADGNKTQIYRDGENRLSKLLLGGEVSLDRQPDGWHLTVPGAPPERVARFLEVSDDGVVHQTDDYGVTVTRYLDGSRRVYVPGDAIGKVDLASEKNKLERNLLSVPDSLVAGRIREDVLDIEFRLKAEGVSGQEKYAKVLYELNCLLDHDGKVPLERRVRWAEELTSLAARPELLSQGRNPTCAMAATEQREYFLHPETFFQMMRRLNDTGLVVHANGKVVDLAKGGALTIEADGDALAHQAPGVVWADGKRLEVSQIAQTAMMDIIRGNEPEPRKKYYASDIEPMLTKLTGRVERFVVQSPKDQADFVNQLAGIKASGNLYAVVQMDAAHLGAHGLTRDGGHVRIVKDIRSLPADRYTAQGLAAKEVIVDGKAVLVPDAERIEVVFGNTWDKSDSHEVMSAARAFVTTLQSNSPEFLELLAARIRQGGGDCYDKAELLAWKTGLLSAVLDKRIVAADAGTAQKSLDKVMDGRAPTARELHGEYKQVESDFVDELCRRRKLLEGERAEQLLRLQLQDMLAGGCINKSDLIDMGLHYKDREYLGALARVQRRLSDMAILEERIAIGELDGPYESSRDRLLRDGGAPLAVSAEEAESLGWALRSMRNASESPDASGSIDKAFRELSFNLKIGKSEQQELDRLLSRFKEQNRDFIPHSSELDAKTRILNALRVNLGETFDKTTFDAVHGIYSQAGMEWKLENLRSRGVLENYEATVLNLAGFKQANDKFSHATGDMVLKAASQYLRDCGLKDAVAVKLAGDKFAIIAPKGNAQMTSELLKSMKIFPASDHVWLVGNNADGRKMPIRIPPSEQAGPLGEPQFDRTDSSGVIIEVAATGKNAPRTISLADADGARSTLDIMNDVHGNGPQQNYLVMVKNVSMPSQLLGHEARRLVSDGRQELLSSDTLSHTLMALLFKDKEHSGKLAFEPGKERDMRQLDIALDRLFTGKLSERDLSVLASVLEREGDKLKAAYQLDRGTGIVAKHHYEELLRKGIADGAVDSLIVCDVKGFAGVNGVTRFNRSLGFNRQVGDAAICATVDALRDAVKMSEIPKELVDKIVVARLGGDELGLVLPAGLTREQKHYLLGQVDSIRLALSVEGDIVDVRRFNPGETLRPREVDIGVAAGLADLKVARTEFDFRLQLDALKSAGRIEEAQAMLARAKESHLLPHARLKDIDNSLSREGAQLRLELHSILQGQGDAASEHVKQRQKQFRVFKENALPVAKEIMDALLVVEDDSIRLASAEKILRASALGKTAKDSIRELLLDGRNREMTVEQVAFILGERMSFSRANPQYAGLNIQIARMHTAAFPLWFKVGESVERVQRSRLVKNSEVSSVFSMKTTVVVGGMYDDKGRWKVGELAVYTDNGTLIGGRAYDLQNQAMQALKNAKSPASKEMFEAKAKLAQADRLTYIIEQTQKRRQELGTDLVGGIVRQKFDGSGGIKTFVQQARERNGELSILDAHEALSINFAELSEKGTARLRDVHLLLNDHPHFKEESMRKFAMHLDDAVTEKIMEEYDGNFDPAVARRFAQHLERGINEYARQCQPDEPLQISVVAMPDRFFKPGELMAYRPGSGQILIRYSDLANPGMLENYALFHEFVHADQDRAKFRLAALTCLRKNGTVDVPSMVEEYCLQSGHSRIDPLELSFATNELKLAQGWLAERRKLSDAELATDPEYIRASRLMESSKNPQPIKTEHIKAQADAIIKLNPLQVETSPSRFLQEVRGSVELQSLYFRSPIFSDVLQQRDIEYLGRLKESGKLEAVLFDSDNKAGLNARTRIRLQCKYLAEQLESSGNTEVFDRQMKSFFEKMMVENFVEALQHKKKVDFRNYVHDQRELEANYAGHLFAKTSGSGALRLSKAGTSIRHVDDMIRELRQAFPIEGKEARGLLSALASPDDRKKADSKKTVEDDQDLVDFSALSDLLTSFDRGSEASNVADDAAEKGVNIMMDTGVPSTSIDWSQLSRSVSSLQDDDEKAGMSHILNTLKDDATAAAIERAKAYHAYLEAVRLHRSKDMGI